MGLGGADDACGSALTSDEERFGAKHPPAGRRFASDTDGRGRRSPPRGPPPQAKMSRGGLPGGMI